MKDIKELRATIDKQAAEVAKLKAAPRLTESTTTPITSCDAFHVNTTP